MNKNNNIATIYHDRHDQLKLLAGSPAKAEFLSKCIYWWQISKYKIKNSDYIWFTRTTDELAAGAGLSDSSIGRYLRDFTQKGLIEKRVIKRYSRKHGQDIACLHIRITDKLLVLLKTNTKKPSTSDQPQEEANETESDNLSQTDDTPSVNVTVPTINSKGNSLNNNIVNGDNVNSGKKKKPSFEKTIFPIEKEIGERVSEELKDRIKGMLYNVLEKQGQKLKHNERLFTEVLFSVTNKEQFRDVTCVKHRIDIISMLIREKRWKTPKGFYKHWDIGQVFKERDEIKRRKTQQEKLERELLGGTCPQKIAEIKERFATSANYESSFDKKREERAKQKEQTSEIKQLNERLKEINSDIVTEGSYLKQMEKAKRQGEKCASQEVIDCIAIKLAKLYEEQGDIERQLDALNEKYSLCA